MISASGPAVVGPMPTITDSLFSLIIFIYVMITFLYLFYGFCWVEPPKLTEEQKKELAKQVRKTLSAKVYKMILTVFFPQNQAARKARPTGPPETTDGVDGTMEDLTERPWPSLAFGRNPFPGQEMPEE